MINTLFLRLIRARHPDWELYEEHNQLLPKTVVTMIKWFRLLCGDTAIVFIADNTYSPAGIETQKLFEYSLSVLRLSPKKLDSAIKKWCGILDVSIEESCLRVAAHEARHYSYRIRTNLRMRNADWWDRWLAGSFSIEELNALGKLAYAGQAFRKYFSQDNNSEEVDAEVAACGCIALWRLTRNVNKLREFIST